MGLKMPQLKSYEIYAIIGIALVVFISLLFGFSRMLVEAVNHVINDLTAGLAVHAYITGFILIAYAAYLYKKQTKRKQNR